MKSRSPVILDLQAFAVIIFAVEFISTTADIVKG